jgi:RimJ/RimL family protein N-acetyltransferase
VHLRPDYPIETARLRLRPLTTDDVDTLLTYRGRADVCRYLPFEPMTRDVLLGRLAGDFARTALTAPGQSLTLGVELADVTVAGGASDSIEPDGGPSAGRLIGDVVLFFHSEEHRGGEIGYVFAPEFRGHGYATEAATALLTLAFDGLGLHRVIARLDARNTDSARVCERLGMRREAHFVRNEVFKGECADEVVYALLAEGE